MSTPQVAVDPCDRSLCACLQKIVYTPKGRAWNYQSPTLGGTANAAFLSLAYSKFLRDQKEYKQLEKRYVCWGRSQLRYMLGDTGRSFVAGVGTNPPTHVKNQAASCQPKPAACNKVRPHGGACILIAMPSERCLHCILLWPPIDLYDRSPVQPLGPNVFMALCRHPAFRLSLLLVLFSTDA